ncbi:hypothetical protein V6N13_125375 [Hibiscus sabdariffa]
MFQAFMGGEVADWISSNLQSVVQFAMNMEDWDLLFGSIIWNLWLARNSVAFDNPQEGYGSILERSRQLHLLSKTALATKAVDRCVMQRIYHDPIHWNPPETGWMFWDGSSWQGGGLLMLHIRELLRRPWDVRLQHGMRARNSVADAVSKLAQRSDFAIQPLAELSSSLVLLLQADMVKDIS